MQILGEICKVDNNDMEILGDLFGTYKIFPLIFSYCSVN